jgi:hypothetical protein
LPNACLAPLAITLPHVPLHVAPCRSRALLLQPECQVALCNGISPPPRISGGLRGGAKISMGVLADLRGEGGPKRQQKFFWGGRAVARRPVGGMVTFTLLPWTGSGGRGAPVRRDSGTTAHCAEHCLASFFRTGVGLCTVLLQRRQGLIHRVKSRPAPPLPVPMPRFRDPSAIESYLLTASII